MNEKIVIYASYWVERDGYAIVIDPDNNSRNTYSLSIYEIQPLH